MPTLAIAGITIAVASDDPHLELTVPGAAGRFVVADSNADVSIGARWSDSRDVVGGETLFEAGSLWRLSRDGQDLVFSFSSPVFGPVPYKTARFDPTFARGTVALHRPYFPAGTPIYPLEYPLDELLLIHILGRGLGAEIHGCGLIDESGSGYLFAGQSGAGKTTMARLWRRDPGVTILSDDRVILRNIGGEIWIFGTPWHGDEPLASPRAAPLSGIFFLRHGAGSESAWLSGPDAVARLCACSFLPFHDAPSLEFTLDFFSVVARMVPCRELTFAPTRPIVQFVRQHTDAVLHA